MFFKKLEIQSTKFNASIIRGPERETEKMVRRKIQRTNRRQYVKNNVFLFIKKLT